MKKLMIIVVSMLALWSMLGLVACGGQDDTKQKQMDLSGKAKQAMTCQSEFDACENGCSWTKGAAGLNENCSTEINDCVMADPMHADSCTEQANSCFDEQAFEQALDEYLGSCLGGCNQEYDQCSGQIAPGHSDDPEGAATDFIDACLEINDSCIDACDAALDACDWADIDLVECGDAELEAYDECVQAAGDDEEALAMCDDVLDESICTVVDDSIEVPCLDDVDGCFDACSTALDECIQAGL